LHRLDAYDAGDRTRVFLPLDSEPGRPSLEAFREIVRAVPSLGGGGLAGRAAPLAGARQDRLERLAAVYPHRLPGPAAAAGAQPARASQ